MRFLSDKVIGRLIEEAEAPDMSGTKYRIIEAIGSGGMGKVYLAEDSGLGRRVALKVLNLPFTEEHARRMATEARVIARLEHPGIVPIHDFGKLADQRVFFVMKFVDGQRLDRYAKHETSLSALLRCFHKVCETVSFAHSNGVIHRDLKPENIMVGAFGEVLVMDWGISKILKLESNRLKLELRTSESRSVTPGTAGRAGEGGSAEPHEFESGGEVVTGDGVALGTELYMPPEQEQGHSDQQNQSSDIYALGAVLYFLLIGHPPERLADSTLKWPSGNGRVPARLKAICSMCLSLDQVSRYQSVDELGREILRYLDGEPVMAYRENIAERSGRWLNRNRALVLLVLAYILMRAVVFLFVRR
jgi:serine/threonine protein kinase